MSGFPLQTKPYEWVTRLWMAQAADHRACYLLVEGPDDVAALQKFAHESCSVVAAGGKPNVELALESATKSALASKRPLQGLLGAVDRDFDHLDGVPASKHPRLARIGHPNDLESAVAHYRGHDLYDAVFTRALVKESAWMGYSEQELDFPFDRLVRAFAGPLGAMRAAWRTSGHAHISLDEDSTLARRLFSTLYSSQPVQQLNLETVPIIGVSESQRRQVIGRAEDIQRTAEAEGDPWRFVRGKDLLDACAFAAFRERCAINATLPESQLRRDMSRFVVAFFDAKLLSECGLEKSLLSAARMDEGKHQYLQTA